MTFFLINNYRFSRSVGITNQGQDYNLDSSYYILRAYRTSSKLIIIMQTSVLIHYTDRNTLRPLDTATYFERP